MGVGGIGLAAPGEDAQHLVLELDADFDDAGVADRVDPERPVDLPVISCRQDLVEDREERLRAGRRQRVGRQDVDLQRQPVLRDADDVGIVVVAADRSRSCR